MKRKLLVAAQAVVTIALLVAIFRGFDWGAFRALYVKLPFGYYLGTLAVIAAGIIAYAWRWHLLLVYAGVDVPLRRVLQQYLIGIFVSNFLPSTVGGDAAKVFYLGREHGYRTVTASVVLDRLLGLGLLTALAAILLWIQPVSDPRYLAARLVLTMATLAFGALVLLIVRGTGGLPRYAERFGSRAVAVAMHVQQFRREVAASVRSPRVWAQSVATVGGYLVLLTLAYRALIALESGVHPPFPSLMMAIAATLVLSTIPIAINGLGLREQLHVLLLEPLGVPREVAVAMSLLLFSHQLLASLVGGLLWWHVSATPRPIVEA